MLWCSRVLAGVLAGVLGGYTQVCAGDVRRYVRTRMGVCACTCARTWEIWVNSIILNVSNLLCFMLYYFFIIYTIVFKQYNCIPFMLSVVYCVIKIHWNHLLIKLHHFRNTDVCKFYIFHYFLFFMIFPDFSSFLSIKIWILTSCSSVSFILIFLFIFLAFYRVYINFSVLFRMLVSTSFLTYF